MTKPITPEEMKAWIDKTWEKCQSEAWKEPRQWVGLTDAELAEFSEAKLGAYDLCLEVEAKLREKNNG